jgi:predicted ATP-dependent endonuclease of OLD family
MYIRFVEIANFRKLKSVRIDLTSQTTLFVGANNSGKTSAMVALRYFLVDDKRFTMNDFTLSHWQKINAVGAKWVAVDNPDQAVAEASITDWDELIPTLDLWFHIEDTEIHHVSSLLPTLDWSGGFLGVRLRFEPLDVNALAADYLNCVAEAKATKEAAAAQLQEGEDFDVKLWPQDLLGYLERRLHSRFAVKVYALDPPESKDPIDGVAQPQPLPKGSEPIAGSPLASLIRVDEINAQRGLGGTSSKIDDTGSTSQANSRKLSEQARAFYSTHLDPTDRPQPSDLLALRAIEKAEELFDKTLTDSFAPHVGEVEGMGYPGVTDPRIKISTRVRPTDALNHDAAVQYEISAAASDGTTTVLRLPEDYNGLGYQNLISMVFRLMGFRAAWMRDGKLSRIAGTEAREKVFPPLHLVLIEEPEAHLHAQVQQVFIRKAYNILRNHERLGAEEILRTQLVVSTHSSHVAHEATFSCLRYFRRLPASAPGSVPTSTVINLSKVFGPDKETERFDTRYLRATHCDLFFADAAILIEGPAERMLIPHFIRSHFDYLTQCYITLLEIGGSHAHKLQPLIEELGLLTLIVSDIDAAKADGGSDRPRRGDGQVTTNATLKKWLPKKSAIDELLDLDAAGKVTTINPLFSIRVAYQAPVMITLGDGESEVLASTFEDALVLQNLATFGALEGTGLIAKFRADIQASTGADALCQALYETIRISPKKAEFALDLLEVKDPEKLIPPTYIHEGLDWLQTQLKGKLVEVLPPAEIPGPGPGPEPEPEPEPEL